MERDSHMIEGGNMENARLFEKLCILLMLIACLAQPVHAFDGGDAAALVIGLIIGIIGIFACIGCYARKKAGQM